MDKVKLTLLDGTAKEFPKGITGKKLADALKAKKILAMDVNGAVWDLSRAIEHDAKVKLLTFDDVGGKHAFWHSCAHVFAHAISRLYPSAKNTIGPAIDEGFYYDFDDLQLTEADFVAIEAEMKKIIKAGFAFERNTITLAEIKTLFPKNQYKIEMASQYSNEGQVLTSYKDGEFTDLCEGPHLTSTSVIGTIKLLKISGAYWKGDQKNKQLTRIYGIGFPSDAQLQEYLKLQQELEKRDHRKIGADLDLFMFHEWSPGSPFLLPKGTVIYNQLLNFVREEYVKRGYQEVITPQLFNKSLWEMSGHWSHYQENMFLLKVDGEDFSLKPMNCPSHALIFKSRTRSYRDLPLRIADFCFLHRNEARGALGGMTRVRKFSQDDAHIFCMPEQIESEVSGVLEFVKYVYADVFKLDYKLKLSTKPEKAMGDPKVWESAEKSLKDCLDRLKLNYEIKPGEGAFYGPKIDIDVKDALGRDWQLATIQLDFQMPLRFGAEYEGQDNKKHTCVMIHRAMLGSIERFIGVLTEHLMGKFPLWLSPVQVRVLTVADRHNEYARKIAERMKSAGLRVELDESLGTINKKVRDAQLQQINYILVVGDKEIDDDTATVRMRNNEVVGTLPVDEFIKRALHQITTKQHDV